jgi:hypothetical protein
MVELGLSLSHSRCPLAAARNQDGHQSFVREAGLLTFAMCVGLAFVRLFLCVQVWAAVTSYRRSYRPDADFTISIGKITFDWLPFFRL